MASWTDDRNLVARGIAKVGSYADLRGMLTVARLTSSAAHYLVRRRRSVLGSGRGSSRKSARGRIAGLDGFSSRSIESFVING